MPYANKDKQEEYQKEWSRKNRPRKYPNGVPKILTADIKEYKKKYYMDNKDKFEAYRNANKEYFAKLANERTWKYLRMLLDHYGPCCACCKELNILLLTVDHINNDGNVDRRPNGSRYTGRALYRKVINEGFPDKYQILCYNCNMGKFRMGGICPHKIYPPTL